MAEYTELIKALRCGEYKPECGSSGCPYWSGLGCMDGQLMEDAAAAIEALQAEVGQWKAALKGQEDGIRVLQAKVPHWVSVEERKPPEYTDVWCAVYTTDIIYMEDGETPEEAIENRQREAARNPRITLGSYSEDESWTDGYFGMPMVCQPDYWLEMTIPEPPQEGDHEGV